jgi:enamine deaminase RidA (YjgF/YER057c/UK114 family)
MCFTGLAVMAAVVSLNGGLAGHGGKVCVPWNPSAASLRAAPFSPRARAVHASFSDIAEGPGPADGTRYYRSATSVAARLPFSDAVRVGEVLWLNNQIGNVPGVGKVEGGLEAQLNQALRNIDAVLAASGLTRRDIFHCTVTLSDMSQWGALNQLWGVQFEPERLPARNVIGVTGLPLGALVGVECQAAFPR